MYKAVRVFACMASPESHPSPEDRQYIHIAPQRRRMPTDQSCVVEVIDLRSDRPADVRRQKRSSAQAASWTEGFQARSTVPPPLEAPTAASELAPPVGYVLPGWEPLLPPLDPAAAQAVSAAPQRQPKASAVPKTRERDFADPFAVEDTGAGCGRREGGKSLFHPLQSANS